MSALYIGLIMAIIKPWAKELALILFLSLFFSLLFLKINTKPKKIKKIDPRICIIKKIASLFCNINSRVTTVIVA